MSLINVSDLTFGYDGDPNNIFENVSFQIDTNWKLGFIGRNGRGKTTFLNLLQRKYKYEGVISSSVDFLYFPFQVSNKNRLTYDILLEIDPDFIDWMLIKELSKLNLDAEVIYRNFDTLSMGEQTKVLLALLFLKENNFLLIDEPTNHLDKDARVLIANYLNTKKGFILVTHDRYFMDLCVDHVLAINITNIEVKQGNFSTWYYNKELEDKYEIENNQRIKKEINRLEESALEKKQWSDKVEKTKYHTKVAGLRPDRGYIGHKSAKMMKRSKNIENNIDTQIEEKSKLLKNIESYDDLKIKCLPFSKKTYLFLENIKIFYDEKMICENINFDILFEDRLQISGSNGCGKTSILKIILGENIKYEGTLNVSPNLKISYISQDTSYLKGEMDNFIYDYKLDETLFKTILRKLDFSRADFNKKLEILSQGEKKKILIAKSLSEEAHLYIWDEPLNYIDIFSRIQIEKLILEYKPTMIFVEHDQIFGEKIANKKLEL